MKWLCGHANTDGGTIYIGVNDDGYVVGLKDSKSFLELLANKITDKLGILASVRLYTAVQGTNLRYGNDVPKVVAGKLINRYACGLVSNSYDDLQRIEMFLWPREIDVLKIFERHPSLLYNPRIADVFYLLV